MSILGAVVRLRPEHLGSTLARLAAWPGVEVSLNPGDGRLVLVLEDLDLDGQVHDAAATLADLARWPGVLNTSLVYEYSGADAPATAQSQVHDYRAWRGALAAPQHPETPR